MLGLKKPDSTPSKVPSPRVAVPQRSRASPNSPQKSQPDQRKPREPAVLWQDAYNSLERENVRLTNAYEDVQSVQSVSDQLRALP
jgi:hypothetical protein